MYKGIVTGIVLTLLALAVGGYFFITRGMMPANADGKPGWLETWMAHSSLRATVKRDAFQGPVPITLNNVNLSAGCKLYAVNCALCHGAADAKASNVAKGLFQRAPQLGGDGVEDDPEGKIYWFVKHGVRLTGMPAFSGTLSDDQVWQVVLFLKHMDALPPAVDKEWKMMPSAAAQNSIQ